MDLGLHDIVISFIKPIPALKVQHGAPLMQSLLQAGLPVASSCRGQGICTKCRVQVVQNPQNLSPTTEREQSLSQQHRFAPDERLSCQAQVNGPITIDTNYW